MKIKSNDKVKIVKGKDKGKSGKVIQCFPKDGFVVVEGLNIRYKHLKKRGGQNGERIEFSSPIRIENVRLVCSKCSESVRIGYKFLENGNKVRFCKKCKELID